METNITNNPNLQYSPHLHFSGRRVGHVPHVHQRGVQGAPAPAPRLAAPPAIVTRIPPPFQLHIRLAPPAIAPAALVTRAIPAAGVIQPPPSCPPPRGRERAVPDYIDLGWPYPGHQWLPYRLNNSGAVVHDPVQKVGRGRWVYRWVNGVRQRAYILDNAFI